MSEWLIVLLAVLAVAAVSGWAVIWHYRPRAASSPFAEFPLQTLQVGEWNFRFHQSGNGPHIILLHGLGANLFCWRFIVPLLARRFTVLALDLPGFGQSDKHPGQDYGLDAQTERLHKFLHALGVKEAFFAGNSMGGNIALWYALKYPGHCLGTVLIAPAASPKLVPFKMAQWMWATRPASWMVGRTFMNWAHRRTVTRKERVDLDRVEETFRTYGRQPAAMRTFLAATESIRDPRLLPRLGEIDRPVLLLWGSEDKVVPRSVIKGVESALKAPESHVHLGGGHHLQEDEPEWVCEKIDSFFKTGRD